jgi:ABC-2 type transport system ATP-binding protein
MSEMALTADHVLVLGRGRLVTETSMADLQDRFRRDVLVRTARPAELGGVAGGRCHRAGRARWWLSVTGRDAVEVGEVAARHGIAVHELTPHSASLEEAYLEITNESVQYRAEVEGSVR